VPSRSGGPAARPPEQHRVSTAATDAHGTGGLYVDDTVLVGFIPGTTQKQIIAAQRDLGFTDQGVIGAGTHVLKVPKGQVQQIIDQLQTRPEVSYAQPNYFVHAMDPESDDAG